MSARLTQTLLRPALFLLAPALALAFSAGTPVHAKAKMKPGNRGVESPNQPVVQHTDFVFDTTPNGYSGLSQEERARILDWFNAIDLGYGDRVSLIGDGSYAPSGVSSAVADLVGQYGLLLADRAPVSAGSAPSGAVRIVVSRSTASVPGCPDWSHQHEMDLIGGLTNEYGCGVNGNLAAMVADPEDLVRGRETRSALRTTTSSRAIKALRDATPTGSGNALK